MLNNTATSVLEFYKRRFEIDNSLTRNILNAIPSDQLDYRPHERSPSTGQTAWTIVQGLFVRIGIASERISDVLLDPHPNLLKIARQFGDASHRHASQLESWTEEK